MGKRRVPASPPETILIISDLHLTSGKSPAKGTWSPTEDFFWDEDLAAFLSFYGRAGRTTLVINGDLFDFLQVLEVPDAPTAERYGIRREDVSRRFGLRCTEEAAVYQIDLIIDGHPVAFRALAAFLASGNRVKIIKGNHDVQLFWENVQERLLDRLEALAPRGQARRIRRGLEFCPWFYYVPGLLYVEHGNQYEASTSFENFLTPLLPRSSSAGRWEIELDLGSFILRYFANRVEVVNPLLDNYRPLSDYLKLLLRRHPGLFLTSARDAIRYLLKSAAKARGSWQARDRAEACEISQRNARLLEEEAARYGSSRSDDRLHGILLELYGRRASPALSRGARRFLWDSAKGPLRALLWLAPLYLLTYVPLFSRWLEAALRDAYPGASIAWLFLLRLPQGLIVLVLLLLSLLIRWATGKGRRAGGPDLVQRLRAEGEHAGHALGVPFVVYGHTHQEDEHHGEGVVSLNTGTWIAVFSEEQNLFRDVHQFTFAKIEGGRAELLCWEHGLARPAVVMDRSPSLHPARRRLSSPTPAGFHLKGARP